MIYAVLRQRHMKEAVHLEEQLDRERQAKMAEARAEMADRRGQEREKLQAAFEEELLELVANPMGLSVQELNAQKEALKKKHKVRNYPFIRAYCLVRFSWLNSVMAISHHVSSDAKLGVNSLKLPSPGCDSFTLFSK